MDYTLCTADNCPKEKDCLRKKGTNDFEQQSYFLPKVENCEFFIPNKNAEIQS